MILNLKNKVLWIAAVLACVQCKNEIYETGDCPPLQLPQLSYSVHVYPIINTTCAVPDCHTTGFANGDFNKFEELQEKAISGKLEFMIDSHQMPHGFTDGPSYLTNCEVETIKKWIHDGAKNN